MSCHCGPIVECDTCETKAERAERAFLSVDAYGRLCALSAAGFRPAVGRRMERLAALGTAGGLSVRFHRAMLEVFRALLPDEKERVVSEL